MPNSSSKITVIVTGDVTMDWDIAHREDFQRSGLIWNADDYISTYLKPGGAAFLANLITLAADKLPNCSDICVRGDYTRDPDKPINPQNDSYPHSYAIWSLNKYDEDSPKDKDVRVWRVKNHLGLQKGNKDKIKEAIKKRWEKLLTQVNPELRLIIIDDANLGFRDHKDIWELQLNTFFNNKDEKLRPWVIVKGSHPVAKGELWNYLSQNIPDRTILVTGINELRSTTAQISRELSWERKIGRAHV